MRKKKKRKKIKKKKYLCVLKQNFEKMFYYETKNKVSI